jgi:hypothetical protein
MEQVQEQSQEQPETQAVPEQEEQGTREERRAQHDFLRFKHEARELKEQNAKLQRAIEEQKENQMRQQEQWKELYEREKEKSSALQSRNDEIQNSFFGSLKSKEIEREAVKLGIRSEALRDLDILDTSYVITETTSQGNVNIVGAAEFVERLKQDRPYWFQQKTNTNINSGNPTFDGPKKYSASDLLQLQKENPAEYQKQMQKRLGR